MVIVHISMVGTIKSITKSKNTEDEIETQSNSVMIKQKRKNNSVTTKTEAESQDRTGDLLITSQMRYHCANPAVYATVCEIIIIKPSLTVDV